MQLDARGVLNLQALRMVSANAEVSSVCSLKYALEYACARPTGLPRACRSGWLPRSARARYSRLLCCSIITTRARRRCVDLALSFEHVLLQLMMDFQFYQTSVPIDVPMLILSTVKSITPTDCIMPLSDAAAAQLAAGM